jgi:hypothetical protein
MFIWVPVGDARPDSYPYEYDETLPPIAFPQEDRNTCVTSSCASCFQYGFTSGKLIPAESNAHLFTTFTEFPAHIEQFGRDYIISPDQDQSKILQSLCNKLRSHYEFSKFFEITKIEVKSFDIWKLSHDDNTILLLQLLGADGFIAHAITVFNGMIFDSNLNFAVPLTRLNIEYCVNGVYIGIFFVTKLFYVNPRKLCRKCKSSDERDLKKRNHCYCNFYNIDIYSRRELNYHCFEQRYIFEIRIKLSCFRLILPSLHQLICLAMLIVSLKIKNTCLSGR